MGITSILPDRVGEDVLERRHAGTKVAHLRVLGGGEREQLTRPALAGHEHAHDVFVGGVTLEAGRAQPIEKRLDIRPAVLTRSS